LFVLTKDTPTSAGPTAYNLALGEARAKSAMNFLMSLGVPADRITVVSYGESGRPVPDHTEECWRPEPARDLPVEVA
jgi:outer membrane protein OmpA-like peptidoglycan-associated protein